MIRYFCGCGTEIFFENSHCSVCNTILGFNPNSHSLLTLQAVDGVVWFSVSDGQRFKLCGLRQELGCNWLIPELDSHSQCLSCRLTRTIPTLTQALNHRRWQRLEQTKRRALYMILRLGLPLDFFAAGFNSGNPSSILPYPLVFDFLEDHRSNPEVISEFVYSGHRDGVITINAAEADDSYRTANRELMNEVYRTLLGHFRHELGHYYGMLLTDEETLAEFRELFGDERQNYTEALEHYYAKGVPIDWRDTYISAYASAHPLEDWAETWAHYLHIRDTVETALAFNAISGETQGNSFEYRLSEWIKLSVVLNALNRSMGVEDAYPFVITPAIKQKLLFIDRLVKAWRVPGHSAAGQ